MAEKTFRVLSYIHPTNSTLATPLTYSTCWVDLLFPDQNILLPSCRCSSARFHLSFVSFAITQSRRTCAHLAAHYNCGINPVRGGSHISSAAGRACWSSLGRRPCPCGGIYISDALAGIHVHGRGRGGRFFSFLGRDIHIRIIPPALKSLCGMMSGLHPWGIRSSSRRRTFVRRSQMKQSHGCAHRDNGNMPAWRGSCS